MYIQTAQICSIILGEVCDDVLWNKWMSENTFKRYEDDSKSFEEEVLTGQVVQRSFPNEFMCLEDIYKLFREDELGESIDIRHFQGDGETEERANIIMCKKSKNALYDLFKKARTWRPKLKEEGQNNVKTLQKRGRTSPNQAEPPSSKRKVMAMEVDSPRGSGNRAPSRRRTKSRPNSTSRVLKPQNLITAYMTKKEEETEIKERAQEERERGDGLTLHMLDSSGGGNTTDRNRS